jgi:hypothetical protein
MRDRVFNTIEDKITIKRCNTQQLNWKETKWHW